MQNKPYTSPTFLDLIENAREYASHKHDTLVESHEFYFGQDGRLAIPNPLFGAVTTLGMEDLALNQLGTRLGEKFWDAKRTIPADFYRQLYKTMPENFAKFSNDLLDKSDGKFLIRGYDDQVRAVLSDRYATLDNLEVLEMAATVMEVQNLPHQIVESGRYYSQNDGVQRDQMAVRVIFKNFKPSGEDGSYGVGVLIRNGETGGAASEVRPLVMRSSCMNSIVFKEGSQGEPLGVRLTHRGQKDSKIVLMAAAIDEAMPIAVDGLAKFLALKMREIDLNATISKLGEEHGWAEELQMAVNFGSEGHRSMYGLVNGITFAAHEMEIDQSARIELESMAATLVHKPNLAR